MNFLLRCALTTMAVGLFLILLASFWPKVGDCNWCVPSYCAFDHDCPDNCACCIEVGEIDGACC